MLKSILMISHSSNKSGGGEDDFQRLLEYFNEKGYCVYSIFPEGPRAEYFAGLSYRFAKVPDSIFPFTGFSIRRYLMYLYNSIIKFRIIISFLNIYRNNINVCFVNSSVCLTEVICLRIFRLSYVLSIKEIINPPLIRNLIYRFYDLTAGRVILISEFLKKIVNKHFSPDKISVIRSSVDENLCRKLLKKTVPGSENEFVISVLGVITPSKNQMLILKALENINVSENIRLNIIGRVEDEKYYRNLLAFSELNIKHPVEVVFTGELSKDDAVEKIIESDLIVITSKYEGMSLVLAEALYLGKPVVSTRTGVAEEIISDGINGFLINSNDYVKLQNIIKDIIDKPDLRTQITSKHTYYYTKYFSMDFYLKQHEKLITNVS